MASLSPGIGSLAQGYGLSGAGRYSARLDAFTKNAKDIEAYDFGTAVESEEAKKQKDAATFIEVASGFKAVPNTSNMYDKHHALLSKKYEVLFSDENMTAMAATPEGRAKFSQAVEQLNQEAKAYENIYSSTFGDPNTATGAGFTYSDQLTRENKFGGSDKYFQDQGFKIDKTDQIFRDQLVDLDNSADIDIATITFDPSTGTWGGVPASDLLTTDLQVASQWFSYKADQAVFTPPSSFVNTSGTYESLSNFSGEEEMLADAKARASLRPLDAIAYWQQTKGTDEDKKKSVQQLYQEMVSGKNIQVATDAYANAMVEEVKARKKREEEEKKKATRSNITYNPENKTGVVFGNLVDRNGFSIKGIESFTISSSQGIPRSIEKTSKGKIQLGYTTGGSDLTYLELNDENISVLETLIPGITEKYNSLKGGKATTTAGAAEKITEAQAKELKELFDTIVDELKPEQKKLIPTYLQGLTLQKGINKSKLLDLLKDSPILTRVQEILSSAGSGSSNTGELD
jgi:hypothetical protein